MAVYQAVDLSVTIPYVAYWKGIRRCSSIGTSSFILGSLWLSLCIIQVTFFILYPRSGIHGLPLFSILTHAFLESVRTILFSITPCCHQQRVPSLSESVQSSIFNYKHFPALPTIVSTGPVPSTAGTSNVSSLKSLAFLPMVGSVWSLHSATSFCKMLPALRFSTLCVCLSLGSVCTLMWLIASDRGAICR